MELDNFVVIVYHDLIVVLSDVIKYHCPLYMGIKDTFHLEEHYRKIGW